MKIKELLSESIQMISQSNSGGSLEGYVVDTDKPQLKNYLESQGASEQLINNIASKFGRISIIKNMYIDDDSRGQGLGSNLLNNAIDDSHDRGAEAILLIADVHESNEFSIVDWYKNYGFEIIGDAGGDPIMLLDEQ
jgi:ribosomal protein S18 acetylase RimI-like enzyme